MVTGTHRTWLSSMAAVIIYLMPYRLVFWNLDIITSIVSIASWQEDKNTVVYSYVICCYKQNAIKIELD
jgi:hypothetical protein